jgi:selenide,water dikinase
MRTLNKQAAGDLHQAGVDGGVHGVTDVTGFGLAGHSWELAEHSGVSVDIHVGAVAVYPGVLELARQGVRTGGDARNRAYLGDRLHSEVPEDMEAVALDPQTSGGLLASVSSDLARSLVSRGWYEIGRVVDGEPRVRLVNDPVG